MKRNKIKWLNVLLTIYIVISSIELIKMNMIFYGIAYLILGILFLVIKEN